MSVRWVRVSMVAIPAIGMGSWWTRPAPEPVERFAPGARDCATGELLNAGATLHRHHERGEGTLDRLAADVLIAASDCTRIAPTGVLDLEPPILAKHGAAWIDANEIGEEALEHALDVWEVATDQRRTASLFGASLWGIAADQAADTVGRALLHPSVTDAARASARARLLAIAGAPMDFGPAVEADREAVRRSWWLAAADPTQWGTMASNVGLLFGHDPRLDEAVVRGEEQVAALRVRSVMLAGLAELGETDCASADETAAAIASLGLRVSWASKLCAMFTIVDGDTTLVSPRSFQ